MTAVHQSGASERVPAYRRSAASSAFQEGVAQGAMAASVRTAAQLTEISETTIRDAINKQKLPAYRVGRSIRIRVVDLDEWLASLVRVGSDEDVAS
jgi:excisionase family DNA binding protein